MIEHIALALMTFAFVMIWRRVRKLEREMACERGNIAQLWEVLQPEDEKFLAVKNGEVEISTVPMWLEKAA